MATRATIEILTPGGRLKAELKKVGRTQKQFAAEMGMRPSHISEMLSNKRPISLLVAAKIEAMLNVPAKELLDLQVAFNMTNSEAAEEFAAGDTLTRLDELVSLKDLYLNNPVKKGTNTERLAYIYKEYGISTCEQVIKSCGFFKKSETTGLDTRKLRTWILIAQKALRKSDSATGTHRFLTGIKKISIQN